MLCPKWLSNPGPHTRHPQRWLVCFRVFQTKPDHGCLLLRQALSCAGVCPLPEVSCPAGFSPQCHLRSLLALALLSLKVPKLLTNNATADASLKPTGPHARPGTQSDVREQSAPACENTRAPAPRWGPRGLPRASPPPRGLGGPACCPRQTHPPRPLTTDATGLGQVRAQPDRSR